MHSLQSLSLLCPPRDVRGAIGAIAARVSSSTQSEEERSQGWASKPNRPLDSHLPTVPGHTTRAALSQPPSPAEAPSDSFPAAHCLESPLFLWWFPLILSIFVTASSLLIYLKWRKSTSLSLNLLSRPQLDDLSPSPPRSQQRSYDANSEPDLNDHEPTSGSASDEEEQRPLLPPDGPPPPPAQQQQRTPAAAAAAGIPLGKSDRDPADPAVLLRVAQTRRNGMVAAAAVVALDVAVWAARPVIEGAAWIDGAGATDFAFVGLAWAAWAVIWTAFAIVTSPKRAATVSSRSLRFEDSRRRRAVLFDLSACTSSMLPVAVLSAAVAAYEILWTKTNQAFPIRTSSAGGTSQTLVEANLSFAATQLSHWAQLIIALLQVTALYAFCWSGWSLVDCLSVDMYDTKLRRTPSPETTCSIVEYITISWFDPLLNEGYKRTLTPADLWDITPDEKVGPSVENFAPVENSKVHLLLKLIWSNRRTIAFQQCLVVLNATLYFGGPFFLNKILRVLEQKEPVYWAYIYTVGMLLAAQAKLITVGQLNQTGRKLAMRMRGVLITLVYKKSLRRVPVLSTGLLRGKEPKTQKKNKTPVAKETNDVAARMGKIVNMMSVDASKVGENCPYLHQSFVSAFQIIVATVSLVVVLGWSALAGVAIMAVMTTAGVPLSRRLKTANRDVSKKRDERTDGFSELLHSVRIMKFLSWEPLFFRQIVDLRESELNSLRHYFSEQLLSSSLWFATPIAVSFATFFCYTRVAGHPLTAAAAFTALSLFNALRWPLEALPDNIISLMDTLVAVERINSFLAEDELPPAPEGTITSLGFSNATFSWDWDRKGKTRVRPADAAMSDFEFARRPASAMETLHSSSVVAVDRPAFELTNLELRFPMGKLSIVCGATGSGKSSLLSALLGEMQHVSGIVHRPARVALAAQQAFILNDSIRNNILFGSPYDPVRYREVLRAAALMRDLEVLQHGDLTEVGEQGINLSGGQKQRISLARAAYSDADICVFDDPLSAVDAPTGRWLLEQLILGPLLQNRTKILVTNAVNLCLPHADFLLLISNGRVLAAGPVDKVLSSSELGDVADSFVDSVIALKSQVGQDRARFKEHTSSAALDEEIGLSPELGSGRMYLKHFPGVEDGMIGGSASRANSTTSSVVVFESRNLTGTETVQVGRVKGDVIQWFYDAFGGNFYVGIVVVGYIARTGLSLGRDYWIKIWAASGIPGEPIVLAASTQAYDSIITSRQDVFRYQQDPAYDRAVGSFQVDGNLPFWSQLSTTHNASSSSYFLPSRPVFSDLDWFLLVYFSFGLAVIVTYIAHFVVVTRGFIRAGRLLHERMLDRLLRGTVRFFETTPTGRILNRFTKDMQSADVEVGWAGCNLLGQIIYSGMVLGTISFVVPAFALITIPLLLLYYRVGTYYLATARSIKRISSVARSPIYGHFSETLAGLATIRAYKDMPRFTLITEEKVEYFNRSSYAYMNTQLWLNMRLQFIGSLVAFLSTVVVTYSSGDAGLVGWILSMTLTINESLQSMLKTYTRFETSMNAIERIKEYSLIPIEPPPIVENCRPPPNWPSRGKISVRHLDVRYAPDLPLILADVSFEVPPRTKVGIVGRTGAGKSSLSLSFFRFMEPSGGSIIIDDVDISRIGLADLRGNLTIIPQDPVLLEGTVRSNLDPFGQYSDEQLLSALRRAHLVPPDNPPTSAAATASLNSRATVGNSSSSSLASGENEQRFSVSLGTKIAEHGKNLSTGQAQLLCLARALVNPSRVVFLDEATASVDNETDARVQETIRSELSQSTILCIAHRLKTVIDYDLILVLDSGRAVEFGSPFELLQPGKSLPGIFRRMCEETGAYAELYSAAAAASNAAGRRSNAQT